MPRPTKKSKPYIVVFCEGESEQVYTDFLRKEFKDVASIKRPSSTGLFEEADSIFQKDKAYQGYAEVTDEIWFFFDVETKDIGSWDARMKIIKRLRSLRKRPGIKVRLLMTTGCIEYWLMLHYDMYAPSIQTVAEKQRVMDRLLAKEPNYRKGDAAVSSIGLLRTERSPCARTLSLSLSSDATTIWYLSSARPAKRTLCVPFASIWRPTLRLTQRCPCWRNGFRP